MWFCFFLLLMNPGDSEPWQWPIDTKHGATSSFGEFRGNRFHMGLDFSTGGVEGMPVRPARSGVVYRLKSGRKGYGRVIYLRHADGHVTVYAHLARFGPALEKAITSAGHQPLSPFGTLDVKVKVARDEVIAWTGESGAGMPHLHFEVRTAKNHALDPLTLPFPKLPQNTGSARLDGLFLLPLNEKSEVNGRSVPFFAGKGVTRVRARGSIGVQVAAFVKGPRGSRLGCRGVRLYADEQLIGEWLPESIDYVLYRQAGLVFDQFQSGFGPTRFTWCFDRRDEFLNPLPGFRQPSAFQVNKPVKLAVELMDLTGKWHRNELELAPGADRQHISHPLVMPVQPTTLGMEVYAQQLFFKGESQGTLHMPDAIVGLGKGERTTLTLKPGTPETAIFWRTEAGNLKRLVGCLPNGPSFDYTLGQWTVKARKSGKFPGQMIFLQPADLKTVQPVLEPVGPVMMFGRPGLPAPGITIGFQPKGQPGNDLGLYRWSAHKKRWRFEERINPKGLLEATPGSFAPILAARDLAAPTILTPRHHNYFTGRRVVIPLRDKGSGIDSKTITITTGEKTISGEYDSDRKWVILPLNAGKGPWTVTVRDRAGLVARARDLSLPR